MYWFSLQVYVPLIPGHARELGASGVWIGLITGSYGIAQLLLRIPTGVWADRIGRYKPFVVSGCALAFACGLVLALSGSPLGLLLGRTLGGLAATCWLAFAVFYGSYFPKSSSLAVIILSAISSLGILAGQSTGPWVADLFGIEWAFLLSIASGLLATLLAVLAPQPKPPEERPPSPSVADLLMVGTNPTIIVLSVLGALSTYLLWAGTFVFVNDWAQQRLGATPGDLGALAFYNGVMSMVATLLGGILITPRLGVRFTVISGFLMSGLTMAVIPLLPDLTALYWAHAIAVWSGGFCCLS